MEKMRKRQYIYIFITCVLLGAFLAGCASTPKGFLKLSENHLKKRQLQMRQYDTTDEQKIITSVAGVLQDLGFTLSESETELGFVAAAKQADAKDAGQIAGAVMVDVLAALCGSYSNASLQCDKNQMVKASVIVMPSQSGDKIVVRVTFQRIVWNMNNQVSRVETINLPEIYQKFFESLSKAIFLEAHKI